jgi:hypothetical protein
MRKFVVGAVLLFLLGGCSPTLVESPTPAVTAPIDTTVAVADAEALSIETLDQYIEITNDIVRGADPAQIGDVVTQEWAKEEQQAFLALEALGGRAPLAAITRFQMMSVRGRHSVVDARAAVCIAGAANPTHVNVTLVSRGGSMVIADISPWKDSTWCAAPLEP